MRISDAERREVARKLREIEGRTTSELTDGELLDLLADKVRSGRYGSKSFDEVLLGRIADLIEPRHETTEDVSDDYGKFECGKCGCRIDDVTAVDNGGINFCPDCGREVIEDE